MLTLLFDDNVLQGDVAETASPTLLSQPVESDYAQLTSLSLDQYNGYHKAAQGFVGTGRALISVTVRVLAQNPSNRVISCNIYAADGVAPNAKPTGAALASSSTTYLDTNLTTEQNITFPFTGFTPSAGVLYFAAIEYA